MLNDYKITDEGIYFTDDEWKTCKAGIKLDYASVNGKHLTKEAEDLRANIMSELMKLMSDKPWSTNTINIECVINIVKGAKY